MFSIYDSPWLVLIGRVSFCPKVPTYSLTYLFVHSLFFYLSTHLPKAYISERDSAAPG